MSKKQKAEKRNLVQVSCVQLQSGASSKRKAKALSKKSSKVRVVKSNYGAAHKDPRTGYCGAAGFAAHAIIKPKLRDISLVITAGAIRKMQYWLSIASGEFAGFAVCSDIKRPLRITNFILLDQRTGGAHADLDNIAIGLHYNDMADQGLQPVQFGRIWFHTHPFGDGTPRPSAGDDNTFERAFGDCQWSVMMVFSNNARTPYAEIQIPTKALGCGIQNIYQLDIEIEPNVNTREAAEWGADFKAHVKKAPRITKGGKKVKVKKSGTLILPPLNEADVEYLDELEDLETRFGGRVLTPEEQAYERTIARINSGVHI